MSAPAVVRRRVIVRGRVQGVFFRDETRREAERRGVVGWVSNEADGSVHAVFEGDAEGVKAMVLFCREGPGRAQVSEVEEHKEQPEGLGGFEVH